MSISTAPILRSPPPADPSGMLLPQLQKQIDQLKTPESFQSHLNRAAQPSRTPADPEAEKKKRAEDAAAGLVTAALILPVLKQVRQSPWAENPVFGGGKAEKTFGPVFDMQLADRIARSPRMAATHILTQKLLSRGKPVVRPDHSPTGLNAHG